MSRKALGLAVAVVLIAGAFGLGYQVGGGSKDYAIYTGDCRTGGARLATCTAGGVAWGASELVAWTDSANVARGGVNDPASWPACLPPSREVKGVRFAGAWLPEGVSGLAATIVWVDCRS